MINNIGDVGASKVGHGPRPQPDTCAIRRIPNDQLASRLTDRLNTSSVLGSFASNRTRQSSSDSVSPCEKVSEIGGQLMHSCPRFNHGLGVCQHFAHCGRYASKNQLCKEPSPGKNNTLNANSVDGTDSGLVTPLCGATTPDLDPRNGESLIMSGTGLWGTCGSTVLQLGQCGRAVGLRGPGCDLEQTTRVPQRHLLARCIRSA